MKKWRVIVEFLDGSEHEFYVLAETEEEAYMNATPTSYRVIEENN